MKTTEISSVSPMNNSCLVKIILRNGWRWHCNCCSLLALELRITSSHEHYAERKEDIAPRWSTLFCWSSINTMFIRPYCQIWKVTIRRNFGTLCEWMWKCLHSCLNLQMGLCYWSEPGAQRWKLLCHLPNYISPTWLAQLVKNILTCQDGLVW